jgi:hypothetical protein
VNDHAARRRHLVDRTAHLRAACTHSRRRLPSRRAARARDRQGTKGTRRPAHPPDRRGAASLDTRKRRPGDAAVFPARHGGPLTRDADRTPTRQARRRRPARLPVAAHQARLDARPAPHHSDAAAGRRDRHLDHRAVTGSRAGAHHARLPARRPRAQAAHPRPHHAAQRAPRPLPRARHPARLPRRSIARPGYRSVPGSERASASGGDGAFRPKRARRDHARFRDRTRISAMVHAIGTTDWRTSCSEIE